MNARGSGHDGLSQMLQQVGFARDGGESSFLVHVLQRFWRALVRLRWIALATFAATLGLGILVTLLTAPEYTATVEIQIDRHQKQVTNVEGVNAPYVGQDMEFYSTQYRLLKTQQLAERVADENGLVGNRAFLAAHGIEPADSAGNQPGISPQQAQSDRRFTVVNLLLAHIEINPVAASKLVDLSYTSRDPELSTRIANGWATAFIAQSRDREYAFTAEARVFLAKRIETLRERLQDSEKNLVLFGSRSGIVTLGQMRDDQGRTVPSRTLVTANLEQLSTALNAATAERIDADSRRSNAGTSSEDTVTSPLIANLRQRRSEIASRLAVERLRAGPEYPAVIQLTQELNSIDESLRLESLRSAQARDNAYRAAVQREQNLRAQVTELRASLDQQNRSAIQYGIYQREADTNRQLYDALLQHYKEIGVTGAVGANNVAIVDPAILPRAPSSPNVVKNIAIAALIGVGLAMLLVVGLDYVDAAIREPSQVQAALGLPLLGITPKVVPAEFTDALKDTRSDLFEALFSLHSTLSFATTHGLPRSISVTSTRLAEGKSSTAVGLARIISRTGRKVLLVDADMRSPSIHALLGADNKAGLSNALTGTDGWLEFVHVSEDSGVHLLTSGPLPPSAAELLSGERIHAFLSQALATFDHVIVDCPPVMGMTDAPLIAKAVEGVVYVVEAGGVEARSIRAAIQRLEQVNARVFGIILSKVASTGNEYGHAYQFGYGRS